MVFQAIGLIPVSVKLIASLATVGVGTFSYFAYPREPVLELLESKFPDGYILRVSNWNFWSVKYDSVEVKTTTENEFLTAGALHEFVAPRRKSTDFLLTVDEPKVPESVTRKCSVSKDVSTLVTIELRKGTEVKHKLSEYESVSCPGNLDGRYRWKRVDLGSVYDYQKQNCAWNGF